MKDNLQTVQAILKNCSILLHEYSWLLDCYVLDYYIDNHWSKLPTSWQTVFEHMDPVDLGLVISGEKPKRVLPLSFLALLTTANTLSLSRQPIDGIENEKDCVDPQSRRQKNVSTNVYSNLTCGNHPRLKNLFLKHVKAKKRHEITRMCEIVYRTACECDCKAAVDLGSGVGHLVRSLAYQYDMFAAGVERDSQLIKEARKLDNELEYTASKHLTRDAMESMKKPLHINTSISLGTDLSKLCPSGNFAIHGLVGLHPCGDLGPFLLRHFAKSENIRFICVVGCCYMKLTCEGDHCGYPMSEYLENNPCPLSYASREIACHAMETYAERLKMGQYHDLQVHSYRAALEVILVGIDKKLKHGGIRSVKHTNALTFERYCELAMERLGVAVPWEQVASEQTKANLSKWRQVVIFYTLRLVLAPVVETVILLDRVLYLLQQGFSCDIWPVFDPRLSPRNHIIVGKKIKMQLGPKGMLLT